MAASLTAALAAAPRIGAAFSATTLSTMSARADYYAFDDATVTTVAGTGSAAFSGDGGAATASTLNNPSHLAHDAAGNILVADFLNNRVRMISTAGVISTFAGTGTSGFSGDGGQASAAMLAGPRGVAVDSSGNVFIADSDNNRIRRVTVSGVISTVAGTGTAGYNGDAMAATSAQLNGPKQVAVGPSDLVYISDTANSRVRRIKADATIETVAGTGTNAYGGDGSAATAAAVGTPWGLALDASGQIYVAQAAFHVVRKVSTGGVISTYAGTGASGFSGDGGAATSAQLAGPKDVALDSAGCLYIADTTNARVRKVKPTGVISTVLGTGAATSTGDGGLARNATITDPRAVLVVGNFLYVSDQGGNRIRKLT